MKLSKIYTRTGDAGLTSLIGGLRVPKSDLHLEAYGTSDELNAHVGMMRTLCFELQAESLAQFKQESLTDCQRIQNGLFDVGSFLAMGPTASIPISVEEIEAQVLWLEQRMDAMNESMEELRSFTLPGGCQLNAVAHIARTVCRRLERACYRLNEQTQSVDKKVMMYVNRLSDYFFVYSRYASFKLKAQEFLWERPLKS